jgi:hypothetical protein
MDRVREHLASTEVIPPPRTETTVREAMIVALNGSAGVGSSSPDRNACRRRAVGAMGDAVRFVRPSPGGMGLRRRGGSDLPTRCPGTGNRARIPTRPGNPRDHVARRQARKVVSGPHTDAACARLSAVIRAEKPGSTCLKFLNV